jgi:hypothetical protein
MNELVAHIKAENAKTAAWVAEDPENRWAGYVVEDLAHWAEYDIYTVAEYEQYMLDVSYSDLYKEIYGVRPRYAAGSVSQEDYDRLLDRLEDHNEDVAYYDYLDRLEEEDDKEAAELLPTKYEALAIRAGYAA